MFQEADKILYPWSKKYGLQISTKYKEVEVRSIGIVDDSGNIYQLWLDLADEGEEITVNIFQQRPRNIRSFICHLQNLEETLEDAYRQINDWISERGNTRTPV